MRLCSLTLALLCLSTPAFAERVIFAGSEDLKEFDKLLEKNRLAEPPRARDSVPRLQDKSTTKVRDSGSNSTQEPRRGERRDPREIEREGRHRQFGPDRRQGPPRPEAEEKRKQYPEKKGGERPYRSGDRKGPQN